MSCSIYLFNVLIDNINMKDIVIIYCIFAVIIELWYCICYIHNNTMNTFSIVSSIILSIILAPILVLIEIGNLLYNNGNGY